MCCFSGMPFCGRQAACGRSFSLAPSPLYHFLLGLLLLKAKQAGLLLSRFVQVIQLPVISFTPLLYYLGLGVFFGLGVYVPTIKGNSLSLALYTQWGLGADYMLIVASQLSEHYFALNLVALFLLLVLMQSSLGSPSSSEKI